MTPEQFKQARLHLNVNQTELCALVGKCVRTIRYYESGKYPIPKSTELLIKHLVTQKDQHPSEKVYFTGCELATAYYHGRRDFRGIILTESGFSGNEKTDFSYADFSGSDFSGHRLKVSFHKSKLTNCNFNKSNLSGVYAGGADFTGSNFTDCDLSDSYLDETIFNHCNLTNANFYGAQWFRKASFKGAVFNNTLLPNKTRHTGKGE